MRKIILAILVSAVLCLFLAGTASAAGTVRDWALFKIYNSPAWVWGGSGAIITPTPNVAKNGLYLSGYILHTGYYNNEPSAFATDSLSLSSGNFEVGLTQKYILLNFERLDVESLILHVKFQPFVTKFLNVAVGAVAVQAGANPLEGNFEDKFFTDAFAVAGVQLGPLFLNAGGELGLMGGAGTGELEQTAPFYFVNAMLKIGGLKLIAEAIGTENMLTEEEEAIGVYNVALATDNKRLNFGLALTDVQPENFESFDALKEGFKNGDFRIALAASFRY